MFTTKNLLAREILDSRGNPTIEVEVVVNNLAPQRAIVPSGASTGSREALELRDGDKKRYLGKGVLNAVRNVNDLMAKVVQDKKFNSVKDFDQVLLELDATDNKSKLGANAILGASMAFCRGASLASQKPLYEFLAEQAQAKINEMVLPVPLMNIFNGGAHASNGIDFQEFMILPVNAPSFREALRIGVEVFHHLKAVLKDEHLNTGVGDEGGFAPDLDDYEDKHQQVLEFIMQAIEQAGYKAGHDIYLGLDVAASEFYENQKYRYERRQNSSTQMIEVYQNFKNDYPILSIEDGLAEQDWDGWKELTQKMGAQCQLVGDDIFVTNPKILKEGISKKIANAVLVKLNQIGTVSETITTIQMAQKAGYKAVISHRSGESEDAFIADLAVATSAGQIKTGSASRSDRLAKYNQLLRIEEALGRRGRFLGLQSFK